MEARGILAVCTLAALVVCLLTANRIDVALKINESSRLFHLERAL